MSKTYGPYSLGEWRTMIMLRSNIAWMKQINREKFAKAIDKETSLYKGFKNGSLIAANDNVKDKQRVA